MGKSRRNSAPLSPTRSGPAYSSDDFCHGCRSGSDLKTCRAYISVLGEKEAKEATIKGLNSAEGYIRRQLARNLNLRNTPEIRFILDESIEYGVNMSKLIDDVTKKDSNSYRQDEEQDEN